MDLVETKEIWSQKHHVMTRLFGGELTKPERPKEGDFMSAFLMGKQDAWRGGGRKGRRRRKRRRNRWRIADEWGTTEEAMPKGKIYFRITRTALSLSASRADGGAGLYTMGEEIDILTLSSDKAPPPDLNADKTLFIVSFMSLDRWPMITLRKRDNESWFKIRHHASLDFPSPSWGRKIPSECVMSHCRKFWIFKRSKPQNKGNKQSNLTKKKYSRNHVADVEQRTL